MLGKTWLDYGVRMSNFPGRLQGPALEPTYVTIEVADNRLRMVAGRRRMGSYALDDIEVERTSIYRFSITVDEDTLEFFPDEPSGFADAVGAVIDLRESTGRFGLKARIEKAVGG